MHNNMGLFIAMETFNSLPLAEVRQIINHKIDLQFQNRLGSVNLSISVQILQHIFPIVHSVIQYKKRLFFRQLVCGEQTGEQ